MRANSGRAILSSSPNSLEDSLKQGPPASKNSPATARPYHKNEVQLIAGVIIS